MNEKEKAWILAQIRNLQDLIASVPPGDPNIPGWKQQIENLKSRLNF